MDLDSALADAEICRDVLGGMAVEYKIHDLPLSPRQFSDATRRVLPPGDPLSAIPRLIKSALNDGEQFATSDGLFYEV